MQGKRIEKSVFNLMKCRSRFSIIEGQQSSTLDNIKQELKPEPKWMRFFKGNQPILINLERSLKNEISDQLFSHMKSNHKSFSFSQLLFSIEKINKHDLLLILKNELFLRICVNENEELNLTKAAVLNLINSEKLQTDHLLFQLIVLQYSHKHFEQMSIIEQVDVLFYMFNKGYVQENMTNHFIASMEKFKDIPNLTMNQIILLHQVLNQVNNKVSNKYIPLLEEQFLVYLEKNDVNKESIQDLQRAKFGSEDAREELYQFFENKLDPNVMDLSTIGKTDSENFLKSYISLFLSDYVRPSDRSMIQKLLILYGNLYTEKMDSKVKVQMMKIQQKFQTIHRHFAYQIFIEAQNILLQYEKNIDGQIFSIIQEKNINDILLYFMNIGMGSVVLSDTLTDQRQAYEIFKLQNLNQLNKQNDNVQATMNALKVFAAAIVTQEPVQLKEFLQALEQTQFEEQRVNDGLQLESALNEKIQNFKSQIEMLGFKKNGIQSQSQIFFEPLNRMLKLIDSVYLQVRTYDLSKLSKVIPTTQLIFKDKELFQKIFVKYGMVPHFLERLLYLQKFLDFNDPRLSEVQDKMSILFNQDPQKLLNQLDRQMSQSSTEIKLKNPYYQEYSEKQELHSEIFTIEDPQNYLLKAANSPIFYNIVQNTHLKQIIREALPEQWIMNYTIYPAMADFVNIQDKIAVFVIDGTRLMLGINDILNDTSRLSISFFNKHGYKVVQVNHQIYSVKRENILKEINKLIVQNFQS